MRSLTGRPSRRRAGARRPVSTRRPPRLTRLARPRRIRACEESASRAARGLARGGRRMKQFRGRVAVVTGGASGIGRALAEAFLGEGMKVVIADVEQKALDRAVAELGRGGAPVSGVATDVSKRESVQALSDRVYATHGACHLLCNNAGVGAPGVNVWETTPNDWKWVYGVNVMGVVHGIQAFVPRMLASGEEGQVLNTSSGDGGIAPLPGQADYASSKAAASVVTGCLEAPLGAQQTTPRAPIFYTARARLSP